MQQIILAHHLVQLCVLGALEHTGVLLIDGAACGLRSTLVHLPEDAVLMLHPRNGLHGRCCIEPQQLLKLSHGRLGLPRIIALGVAGLVPSASVILIRIPIAPTA